MIQKEFITYSGDSQLITDMVESKINKKTISFDNREWETFKMRELCSLIAKWQVEELWIYSTKNRNILIELSFIDFSKVREISLCQNQIESIQGLSKLSAPKLTHLYLSFNNISSIRQFSKGKFDQLQWLSIAKNRILQGSSLTRMKCQSVECLDNEFMSSDNLQINSITWMCKMESTKISKLKIRNRDRIKQKKVQEVLRKKSQSLVIQN